MRRGLVWVGLLLAGCSEVAGVGPGRCRIDDDCAAAESCVSGVCERRPGIVLDSGFTDLPDAGVFDEDAGVKDAEIEDAAETDAGARQDAAPRDAAAPDLGVAADAGPDAGPVDVGPPDAGFVDAGPPDTGAVDAGPPTDAGPVARGTYQYRRILVPGISSNRHLARALVSPDDATLLVSGRYTDLFVIDRATETLRGAVALPSAGSGRIQRVDALWIAPTSSEALVAATVLQSGDIVEGRVYRLSLSGTQAPTQIGGAIVGVAPQAIAPDPVTGELFLVGYRDVNGAYWLTVHSLDPTTGATTPLGQQFTSAGCQDGVVVADGLGGRGIAYVCGINGAEVGVRDSTGVFVRGPNTGNTARISARPQGDYAIAVTWSSGRLAKFEQGQWDLGFNAPNVSNAAWNVVFSDDGARALVTGQFSGSIAVLYEYRHPLFATAELTNVSISGFDSAPWLGQSGVIIEDAAWRPGADCGYLVGGCDSVSCTRGYLVGFEVGNGRRCP